MSCFWRIGNSLASLQPFDVLGIVYPKKFFYSPFSLQVGGGVSVINKGFSQLLLSWDNMNAEGHNKLLSFAGLSPVFFTVNLNQFESDWVDCKAFIELSSVYLNTQFFRVSLTLRNIKVLERPSLFL